MARRAGVVAAIWWAGCCVAGGGETGVVAQTEAEAVQEESAALQRQVEFLSRALADARAEIDALTAALARRELERSSATTDAEDAIGQALAGGIRLADVNRELRMVAVGAGRRQGVAAGMVFAVMHGDRAVARVRVVDVRPTVAGAVLERRELGAFPEKGDRVLLDNTRE